MAHGAGLRKYKRLDDAIRERGGPLGAVFAVDVKPKVAYKHFFSGGGWRDVWQRLTSSVKPERWNWYEIIPEDQPCNLHIDFEFYKRTNPALTPELHTYFLLELCLFLRETFGDLMSSSSGTDDETSTTTTIERTSQEMEDGDPFVLAAENQERARDTLFDIAAEFPEWREELSIFQICCVRSRTVQAPEGAKVSFHTIVRVRDFCFRNNYHVGAFMRRFELHLLHKYGGPADNPYFVRPKKSPHISHKLMPSFDRQTHTLVYSAEQRAALEAVPTSERTQGGWENPIDAVIYTMNRNFRMPYNTKALDYRPIFPLNQAARFEARLDAVRDSPDKLHALETVLWKSMVMRHYACFRLGSVCYVQPNSQILSCPEPDGTAPMSISNARAYYYLFDPVAHPPQSAYLRKLARRRDGTSIPYQKKNFLTTEPLMRDDFGALGDEKERAKRFFFHLDEQDIAHDSKEKEHDDDDTNYDDTNNDDGEDEDEDEEDSAEQSGDERRSRYIQQIYTACKRLVPYVAVRHGYPAAVMYSKSGICWNHRASRAPLGTKGQHPRIHLRTRCHMCDIFPGARDAKNKAEQPLYTHSGNHVFFDIYYMDGRMMQGCWDGDCSGDRTYGRLFNPTARGRMSLSLSSSELADAEVPEAVRRAHHLYKESVKKLRLLDQPSRIAAFEPSVSEVPLRECSGGGSAEQSIGHSDNSSSSNSNINSIGGGDVDFDADFDADTMVDLSTSSSSTSTSTSVAPTKRLGLVGQQRRRQPWIGKRKAHIRSTRVAPVSTAAVVRLPKQDPKAVPSPPTLARKSSRVLTFRSRTRGRKKSLFK